MASRFRPEDWNPETVDRLAEEQRERLIAQGALEPEPPPVFKLRCQACSILIGPGFLSTDVWYDQQTNRLICRSCALWPGVDRSRVHQIATPQDVSDLSIGDLSRELRRRIRQHKRRRPRP